MGSQMGSQQGSQQDKHMNVTLATKIPVIKAIIIGRLAFQEIIKILSMSNQEERNILKL